MQTEVCCISTDVNYVKNIQISLGQTGSGEICCCIFPYANNFKTKLCTLL